MKLPYIKPRTFNCRECGQFHELEQVEEHACRTGPPWTRRCTCGSGYQILKDKIHHFTWGPNHVGGQLARIVIPKLPPLPARPLPPLPKPENKP